MTTAQSRQSAEAFEAAEGDLLRQFTELFAAAGDIQIFLQRLADAAPDEIRPDLEALAAASEPDFVGAVSNPAATFVAHLATSLSTANAAKRVDDYAQRTCGQPVFGELVINTVTTEASPRREGDVVVINGTSIHGTARCPGGFYPDLIFKIEQDVAVAVCGNQAFAIDFGAELLPELWHRELPGEAIFWDLRGDSFVVSWQEALPPQGLSEELVTETVASFDLRTGEERWSTQLIGPESPHGVQSVEHVRFGVTYYGLGPGGEVVVNLPTGDAIREGAFEGEPSSLVVFDGNTGEEVWREPEVEALDFEGARSGLVIGRSDLVFRRFDTPAGEPRDKDTVTLFGTASGTELLRQEDVFDGDVSGSECSPFVMLGDVHSSAGEGYWVTNTVTEEVFMAPRQPDMLTPVGLLDLEYLGFDEGDALTMRNSEGELWRLAPEVFTDWEYVEGLLVVANPNGEVFEVDLATGEVVAPWQSKSPVDDNLLPENVDSGWAIAHTGAVGQMSRWEHSRCPGS